MGLFNLLGEGLDARRDGLVRIIVDGFGAFIIMRWVLGLDGSGKCQFSLEV